MNRRDFKKVFKAAKGLLGINYYDVVRIQEKDMYICCALDAAQNRGLISNYLNRQAESLINKRLEGSVTLDAWCMARGLIGRHSLGELRDPDYVDNMQAFRHRWLDALIKEFSA